MGILDTLLGRDAKDAANTAAADTYAKQQAAAAATRAAGAGYSSRMTDLAGSFDPYVSAGGSALERLLGGLGLGGNPEEFTAAYRALPGYTAGRDSALDAVRAKLNAGPGVQSGGAMRALARTASDYEDARGGDYLSRLMALVGGGQTATGSKVATTAQGYGGELNANLAASGQQFNAAPTIGQGQVAGANAESSALGNLLAAGSYLGGAAMGGGFGSSFGKWLFPTKA